MKCIKSVPEVLRLIFRLEIQNKDNLFKEISYEISLYFSRITQCAVTILNYI